MEAKVTRSTFLENKSAQGGAIFSKDVVSLFISNCTFVQNAAGISQVLKRGEEGPIIFAPDPTLNLKLADTSTYAGGAIFAIQSSDNLIFVNLSRPDPPVVRQSLVIVHSSFSFNQAVGNGGALYLDNVCLTISSSQFFNNSAEQSGAGLFLKGSLTANITGSYFWDNFTPHYDREGNLISITLNNIACDSSPTTTSFATAHYSPSALWDGTCDICSLENAQSLQFVPHSNNTKYYPCGTASTSLFVTFGLIVGGGGIVILTVSVCYLASHVHSKNEKEQLLHQLSLRRRLWRTPAKPQRKEEEGEIEMENLFDSYPFEQESDPSLRALVSRSSTPESFLSPFISVKDVTQESNTPKPSEKESVALSEAFDEITAIDVPLYPDLQHPNPKKTSPTMQRTSETYKRPSLHNSMQNLELQSLKSIDYKELDIDLNTPVGAGAFGIVYRARWRGTEVAVKKLIKTMTEEQVYRDIIFIIFYIRHKRKMKGGTIPSGGTDAKGSE